MHILGAGLSLVKLIQPEFEVLLVFLVSQGRHLVFLTLKFDTLVQKTGQVVHINIWLLFDRFWFGINKSDGR